jgi:AraC-like DNA-binding protein
MPRRFRLDNVWRAAIHDLGLSPEHVLRRAELPVDLLRQPDPMVDVEGYFRLVEALDSEAGQADLGLSLGQRLTVDVFDPTLFAAACSPNLEVALQRVSTYKRLMGPFRLQVERVEGGLRVEFHCLDRPTMPRLLGMVDLTFSLHWIRHATRVRVVPRVVEVPTLPDPLEPYAAYFGRTPDEGDRYALVFSEADVKRPFLTVNSGMWRAFEPELRRRLSELETEVSFRERVQSALLELLPSGRCQRRDVAASLGVGERTLQRRLRAESTSFQETLAQTRESLARHYLVRTRLSPPEIAYLLGFDDPNSLYRAFHRWTGTTPESVRRAARGQA